MLEAIPAQESREAADRGASHRRLDYLHLIERQIYHIEDNKAARINRASVGPQETAQFKIGGIIHSVFGNS